MSVPQSLRSESKLDVIIKARSLASYTIQITKNPKTFPPEYNNGITNRIIESATKIYMNCWTANNIYVKSVEDLQERLWLQETACLECNNLLALIQLAQPIFHLKTNRIKFWGSKAIEVRNKIRAWNESDKKRYKESLGV